MKLLLLIALFVVPAFSQDSLTGRPTPLPNHKIEKSPITVVSRADDVPTQAENAEIVSAFKEMDREKICARCTSSSYDKVTDRTTVAGNRIVVSANKRTGFVINTYRWETGIITLNFGVVGGGNCIDKNPTIALLFRDETRIAVAGLNDFNCDGQASLYFRGPFTNERTAPLLEALKTKQLETIRISTFRSSVQQDFTKAQSIELMNQLSCLDVPRTLQYKRSKN